MRIIWLRIKCHCCRGLQWGGYEPIECRDCNGNGSLWINAKDRLRLWPRKNAPFAGTWPGEFAREMKRRAS